MKIGMCCAPRFALGAKKAGYDYWEIGLNEVATLGKGEYANLLKLMREIDFFPETSNRFFINEKHRLVGDDVNMDELLDFTKLALERADEMGVKISVVGSGNARRVPEGYSKERALSQFSQLVYKMAEIAKEHNILLTVEPLRYEETNLINTVAEGIDFVKGVGHSNVRGLCDLYHILCNGEGYDGVRNSGGLLCHAHIACEKTRHVPQTGDGFDYHPFFEALKAGGFTGGVSMEGGYEGVTLDKDGVDYIKAIEYFR